MRYVWLALLAGCSGSGNSPDAHVPPVDVFGSEATCLIKGGYGALGTLMGTFNTMGGTTNATIVLDPGPPGKDDLFIKLVAGKGVFVGGLKTGVFDLTGAETDYNTCGACVIIIADLIPGQGPSKFYLATSGTLTLSSVTQPMSGSGSNLLFDEIGVNTFQKIPGGCHAGIDSMSFVAN